MKIEIDLSESAASGWNILHKKHNEQRAGQDLLPASFDSFFSEAVNNIGTQEFVRDSRANHDAIAKKLRDADPATQKAVQDLLK